ncbi:lactate utilization protein B [Desulfolutivibrio sp.]|uniref:lactate utilization protein B n=1 Tax=Desulfolutivibrio sp. TaxID=2773296 RepID=UPI002F96AEDA
MDTFEQRAEKAAADMRLRGVLQRAAGVLRGLRERAFADFEDFEAARQRLREARLRAVLRLPEMLARLEERVTAAGGVVHYAGDARQAREIVVGLARERDVRLVVKGKSMISEEIGLNGAFAAVGIESVETDLGEYIIQLAGEGPSHIISPALHKSKDEVAALFLEKLGRTADTAPELTRIAREALREKFLAADMGVTGANMAVADTGSVILLENEGNIRFSTTCPRVHVAVMSIEKVVETLGDAGDVLALLPRSATGQRMPVYLSVFTGPRRADEADGAGEFHLVLLDNGRSRILADPLMREMLLCVRCGACLNVCPVYKTIGGHAYGWVYPGPMGSVLTPLLMPSRETFALAHACTGCGACREACPAGIDHPGLLLELRRRGAEDMGWCGRGERLLAGAAAATLTRPLLYRGLMGGLRALDPGLAALSRFPGLRAFARRRMVPRLKPPFWTRAKASARARLRRGGDR